MYHDAQVTPRNRALRFASWWSSGDPPLLDQRARRSILAKKHYAFRPVGIRYAHTRIKLECVLRVHTGPRGSHPKKAGEEVRQVALF